MELFELKAGDKAKILGFRSGDQKYQRRLLAMGFVPEAEFKVIRVAPLGDPIELQIQNTSVCLRRAEGSILEIEPIGSQK